MVATVSVFLTLGSWTPEGPSPGPLRLVKAPVRAAITAPSATALGDESLAGEAPPGATESIRRALCRPLRRAQLYTGSACTHGFRRCERFGWRRPLRSARLVITPEMAHLKRCAPARGAWGGIGPASHLEVRECATLSGSRRHGRVAVSGGVAPGYVISAPSGRYSAFIVYVKGLA